MSHLIAGVFGATRQGKTTLTMQMLSERRSRRLLIFDPMGQYADFAELVPDLGAMLAAVRAARAGGFALRYVPPRASAEATVARFDALCALAYDAGDLDLVAEELQLVTRPSWAPPAWSECTLRGGHRGVSIIGLSQRPASVDKNFFSNCSAVVSFRLNFEPDARCMAGMLFRDPGDIVALPQYTYIARDMNTGQVSEGVTRAPNQAAAQKKPAARRRRQ